MKSTRAQKYYDFIANLLEYAAVEFADNPDTMMELVNGLEVVLNMHADLIRKDSEDNAEI